MPRKPDRTGITRTARGWLVRVQVRPFPARAKRYPRGTAIATMQAWRTAMRDRDRARRPVTPDAGTIEADVAVYLQQWGTGKHPITVLQRTRYLQLWAAAFRGRYRTSLTTPEIERQLQLWQTHGLPVSRGHTRQPDLKASTLRKVRQALYQLFAVCDRGAGRANPVDDVPAGTDPEPDPGGQPFAVIRRVLAALPRSKSKARCYVMAYIGLRPAEVRALRPEDGHGRTLFVRTAKGGPRVRVPLTRRGAAAWRYLAARQAWGSFTCSPLDRMLNAAAATAGYSTLAISAYTLRHSFGTWHYAATRDIKATKEAMRHTSLRMTERYVRAAVTDALDASIQQLDRAQRRAPR